MRAVKIITSKTLSKSYLGCKVHYDKELTMFAAGMAHSGYISGDDALDLAIAGRVDGIKIRMEEANGPISID